MPIITSQYKPPFFTKNPHIATIYSGLFRRVRGVKQERERMTLADGDFMDLDWSFSEKKSNKLLVLLHGLEGDAQRHYMLGAAKLFNQHEGDAVCVNFRGCSGEENIKFRSYHSGVAEDLEEVIQFILNQKQYTNIYLNGFSLGGNVILKYLGEHPQIPLEIKGAVAVSVPIHLKGSMLELHTFKNILYNIRFKQHLLDKLKRKRKYFPEELSAKTIKKVKTLKDFDDVYTSKAHGFKDAYDYYKKSSSLQFLPNISVPTLLLNALNDSFLSPECYPVKEAKANPNLYLEMPDYGGHVGFYEKNSLYYSEKRTLEFIQSL